MKKTQAAFSSTGAIAPPRSGQRPTSSLYHGGRQLGSAKNSTGNPAAATSPATMPKDPGRPVLPPGSPIAATSHSSRARLQNNSLSVSSPGASAWNERFGPASGSASRYDTGKRHGRRQQLDAGNLRACRLRSRAGKAKRTHNRCRYACRPEPGNHRQSRPWKSPGKRKTV